MEEKSEQFSAVRSLARDFFSEDDDAAGSIRK